MSRLLHNLSDICLWLRRCADWCTHVQSFSERICELENDYDNLIASDLEAHWSSEDNRTQGIPDPNWARRICAQGRRRYFRWTQIQRLRSGRQNCHDSYLHSRRMVIHHLHPTYRLEHVQLQVSITQLQAKLAALERTYDTLFQKHLHRWLTF